MFHAEGFSAKFLVFTLRVCGVNQVIEAHDADVPSSTSMLSLNTPSMQEGWSFCSHMGLFLNYSLSYEDLEYLVRIFSLSSLLLHRLCFAHLYKASGNQYLLLFGFGLLVLILLVSVYT